MEERVAMGANGRTAGTAATGRLGLFGQFVRFGRLGQAQAGRRLPGCRLAGLKLAGLTVACTTLAALTVTVVPAQAQLLGGTSPGAAVPQAPNPLADTTMKPGKALLFELEAKFARATAEGGGKAFATWFAEDGISLANGEAPVRGRAALAKGATWSPKDYQLTWTPTDAVLSAAGDMGYTWGHYEGRSWDANGNPKVTSGRYFTIWQKQKDGEWKVVLDASNEEPAGAGDCCKLPPG